MKKTIAEFGNCSEEEVGKAAWTVLETYTKKGTELEQVGI